jgi:hypothetical protein
MTTELTDALAKREAAALAMETAAAILTRTQADFTAASADALRLIAAIAVEVGAAAQARATSEWAARGPAGTEVEAAHRRHSATTTGAGAAGAIEHRLCHALTQGFSRESAAETFGHELSPEAAEFLSHATRVAVAEQRPGSQPTGKFGAIVRAQNQQLNEIIRSSLK